MEKEPLVEDPLSPFASRIAEPVPENAPTCPLCDYILTGLTSGRCPECGTPVDIERMRRLSSDVPQAATAWERDGGWRGFFETWQEVLLRPTAFASLFPGRHYGDRAIAYGMLCIGAGAVLYVLICLLESWVVLSARLSEALGFVVAVNVTNALIAAWAARTSAPRYSRAPYHFWRGLTHYASGPVLFVGIGAGLVRLSDAFVSWIELYGRTSQFVVGLGLIVFGVFMWLSRLTMMARRQCRDRAKRIAMEIHPWAAVLIGAFCGFVVVGIVRGPFEVVGDVILRFFG